MVEVSICGLDALRGRVKEFAPDLVISITNPEENYISRAAAGLVEFDGPVHSIAAYDSSWDNPHGKLVTAEDIENFFNFLDENLNGDSKRILVHCHAGMSRSPSFALGVLAYEASLTASIECREIEEDEADVIVGRIAASVTEFMPNERIIRGIERHLRMRGLLSGAIARMGRGGPEPRPETPAAAKRSVALYGVKKKKLFRA